MQTFHTFDFKAAKKRIEPNIVDEYQVHAEDYESINELIARCVRTKTKYHEDKMPGAEYDLEYDDQEASQENVVFANEEAMAEQSKAQADEAAKEDVSGFAEGGV